MDEIVRAMTEHPLVAMAVGVSTLLLVYLLFKSLIKLALILILVVVVVAGYSYLRDPGSKPVDIKDTVEKVGVEAGRAVDQGKSVYEKGKEWMDLGRRLLDKGIDTGKDAVEKGKAGAGSLVKGLEGERDAGNRQKP